MEIFRIIAVLVFYLYWVVPIAPHFPKCCGVGGGKLSHLSRDMESAGGIEDGEERHAHIGEHRCPQIR